MAAQFVVEAGVIHPATDYQNIEDLLAGVFPMRSPAVHHPTPCRHRRLSRDRGGSWGGLGLASRKLRSPAVFVAYTPWQCRQMPRHIGQEQSERDVDRLTRSVASLTREVAALRSEMHRWLSVRTPVETTAGRAVPAVAPASETAIGQADLAPVASAAPDLALRAERELASQARVARHDPLLEQEAVDPNWAPATIERIKTAFDDAGIWGSRLTDMDCRASRCRITVRHDSESAGLEFQRSFPLRLGSVLQRAVMSHFALEDGTARSIMHLSRESVRR